MSPRQRLLHSFVVSPLAAFPVTAGIFQLWWLVDRMTLGMTLGPEDLDVGAFFGRMALLVAYPVMLVLGIPISLALRKLNLFRMRVMVFAGGLAGAIPFIPMTVSATKTLNSDLLSTAVLDLVAGVLSGAAIAWLVWRISTGASRSLPTPPRNDGEEDRHAHRAL